MPDLAWILAIALPLLMTAGAVAALKSTREHERRQSDSWRDTSLDDWRSERVAAIEAERSERAASRTEQPPGPGEETAAVEPVRQQRLGG